jgi:hypothetical protein
MTPDERYQRDPMFRHLVDQLHHQIREARYTPTEIREAAMLAQIHYEQTTLRPIFVALPWEPECGKF